jgi:hypothetical protein
MNTHSNSDAHLNDAKIENPDTGYDRTDLSATGVLGFLVGLAIVMLLIHIVLWGMYRYLDHYQASVQPRVNPLQTVHDTRRLQDPVGQFPSPRLQADPVLDLERYRAQQDYLLSTYGQSSATGGGSRIPIERAMDLLVQQGLPTRPQGKPGGAGNPSSDGTGTPPAAAGKHQQTGGQAKNPAQ